MNEGLITRLMDTSGSEPITLLVLGHKIPAKKDDVNDKQRVATDMCSEGNKIARLVPAQEHLGTCTERTLLAQQEHITFNVPF